MAPTKSNSSDFGYWAVTIIHYLPYYPTPPMIPVAAGKWSPSNFETKVFLLHQPSLEFIELLLPKSFEKRTILHNCHLMLSVNDIDDLPDMLGAVQQAYLDSPFPGSDTGFPEPDIDFPEDDTPLEMDHGFPEPDPPEFPDNDPYAVVLKSQPLPITTAELHHQYLHSLPDPGVDESVNFRSISSLYSLTREECMTSQC
jgi:hypothetical protein